ncbi:MAG: hypothetical protein J0H31_08480 [Alphaproteobacteria bacterium]|nr:hypothetical protein [Alphaproteobacteria bacterium]
MTKLFEHAVQRVRTLPPELQDEYARVLLRLAGDEGDEPVHQLGREEKASLATSRAQAVATDEDVRAVWAKHGL